MDLGVEYTFITEGLALYLLYAGTGLCLFLVALLGTFKKFRARVPLICLFFAAFLGLSYFSLGELLGRPKPVGILTWDRPDVEEARVLGMFFEKDKAIYLLLVYPGQKVPRYYQFPWDDEAARELKRAQQGAQLKENQGVKLKWPFQPSHEDRKFPEVHEIPWPAPPAKDTPPVEMLDLNQGIDA